MTGVMTSGCDGMALTDGGLDATVFDAATRDAAARDGGLVDASDAGPDRHARVVEQALDYLEVTDDELGLDVVVSIQIYAAARGSARASQVAEDLRGGLRPSEVERYGVLLDIDTPPLPPLGLGGARPSATTPDPMDTLLDDRITRCLDEVLACTVSPECVAYVELRDRWGYVLTHQAVTLLFAAWTGCPLALDEDAVRRSFAANLIAAMEADPAGSDLASERIAMLGHLGFASEIDPVWIDNLVASQRPSGCFPVVAGGGCHPHPTGVALWALSHATP